MTYGIGRLLRLGVFSRFKETLAKEGSGTQRAIDAVQKHGLSIGVHLPSCCVCKQVVLIVDAAMSRVCFGHITTP